MARITGIGGVFLKCNPAELLTQLRSAGVTPVAPESSAMSIRLVVVLPVVLVLSGCAATARQDAVAGQQPSIADIARGYQSFVKVTKDVVSVNPDFGMLCSGASAPGTSPAASLPRLC